MNRTTIISIIATSLIIGISIGVTHFFSPSVISNIEKHKQDIKNSDTMKNTCTAFKNMFNQQKQSLYTNNVMAYNLQRLHGQCYIKVGNDRKPVELVKLTGCHGNNFEWTMKEDSNILDFCD